MPWSWSKIAVAATVLNDPSNQGPGDQAWELLDKRNQNQYGLVFFLLPLSSFKSDV